MKQSDFTNFFMNLCAWLVCRPKEKPTKLEKLQKNWFFILDKNQRFVENTILVGNVCNAETN